MKAQEFTEQQMANAQNPPPLEGLGEVELKSPAVQEILGRPPRWIIRWGITVILIIIGGILIGTYFFKYPDVISATIEVTTENLPSALFARATGKLDTLFVADNETVKKGDYLAVIENSACFGEVLRLKKLVAGYELQVTRSSDSAFYCGMFPALGGVRGGVKGCLGELQTVYYQFVKACEDYQYFVQADYYNQKINALKRQIALQQKLGANSRKQSQITKEQLQSQQRLFSIDSTLYAKKTITLFDYENAKKTFLQMQQSYENALASIDNAQLTIAQYEQTIFDLQQQGEEKKKELLSALSALLRW
jgi:multidrug efflux pump subunit AcrA (membrane-fusion protein)